MADPAPKFLKSSASGPVAGDKLRSPTQKRVPHPRDVLVFVARVGCNGPPAVGPIHPKCSYREPQKTCAPSIAFSRRAGFRIAPPAPMIDPEHVHL